MTESYRRARAIAIREIRSFFASPIGWTVLSVFCLIAGLVFVGLLIRTRQAAITLAQTAGSRPGMPAGLHVSDWVVRPYLFNLGSVLLFFVPLLTMRSFAEERRGGSLELLFSLPVRGVELTLGKFGGGVLSMLSLLAIVPVHAAILGAVSRPDWAAAFAGLVGLVLLGCFMTAFGLLISALSQSQIEAGVLTLGLFLLLGLGPGVAEAVSPAMARALGFVAVLSRFEDFTRGVIDLRHVAFFLGGTILALALTLRSLDLLRWRGV
ncbi:MAG: ABC transporter permease [Candidatus Eisenbacteria bacterium]|nr:ABC transporter permease subunit [Candidatus Eisenbacteria bacterium]